MTQEAAYQIFSGTYSFPPELRQCVVPPLGKLSGDICARFCDEVKKASNLTSLEILCEYDAALLHRKLLHTTHIKTLKLATGMQANAPLAGVEEVSNFLAQNPTLNSVTFCHECSIHNLKILARGLKKNSGLKKLSFSRSKCGQEGVNVICASVPAQLSSLCLEDCSFSFVSPVIQLLSTNKNISSLDISENSLKAKEIMELLQFLEKNTSVTNLKMRRCGIRYTTGSIFKLLGTNNVIKSLDVSDQTLATKNFCDGLKLNTTLTSLKFNNSKIGSKGVGILLKSIKHNTSLQVLKIGGCFQGNSLSEDFHNWDFPLNLTSLDLSNNDFLPSHAESLSSLIRSSTSLKILHLVGKQKKKKKI